MKFKNLELNFNNGFSGFNNKKKQMFGSFRHVILKLCAAAHYCAARILKMCREDIEKIQLYKGYF